MSNGNRIVIWRLPVLLALVLVAIIFTRGWMLREVSSTSGSNSVESDANLATGQSVSLTVEFGDGAKRQFDGLPYREGMTVRDLLAAAQSDDGSLRFLQRGSGNAAMLIELGGIANQGGDGRNWMYWVNDELARESFEIHDLKPGDRVLWKFVGNE